MWAITRGSIGRSAAQAWRRGIARVDAGADIVPGAPGARRVIWLNRIFLVGVAIKTLDGVFETLVGLPLFFLPTTTLIGWIDLLTSHELEQNPDAMFATMLRAGTTHLLGGSSGVFIAVYLLTHGLVKLVLAWAVVGERYWAYPWMLGALTVFACYQIYELALGFSTGLFLLTIFDAVIIWLTWWEWRRHVAAGRA